jgi:hypothetical protein
MRAVKLPSGNYSEVSGKKAKVSGWGHSQVVRASTAFMAQNKLPTIREVPKQEVRCRRVWSAPSLC